MIDAAWSDAILAGCALAPGCALTWRGRAAATARTVGGVGLLAVGCAASLGTLRFGGLSSLVAAHDGATWIAATVGIPMVGLAYALPRSTARAAPMIVCLALLGAAWALHGNPTYRTLVGGGAMGVALVGAAARFRQDAVSAGLGVAGALGVVVAGLGIAGDGHWGPLSRIAWFHLAFAVSCAALGGGLLRTADGRLPAG
jgi:hypothetical protein